ncbi:sialidase family protein [Martelella sp. HB161492]|uniref:sialidase family protein n=1 Tax=Martelella sp. HB161492 TaxID=2720726 RepID=UPI001AEEFA97|nr:sialidase family protein [Martelella sp. HB161492]
MLSTFRMTLAAAGAVVVAASAPALAGEMPFTVKDGLFDLANQDTLGLSKPEGVETVTVFAPGDDDWQFVNGIVLIPFKGKLYAQWQSSKKDEDATETVVVYAVSDDGKTWSKPVALTAPWNEGYHSNGGWITDGDTLVAFINTWPDAVSPRGGHAEYMTSTDGETWSAAQPVMMADGTPMPGIFEQDPHRLPSGRIINAAHMQPGLTAKPIYTDDPLGLSGWHIGKMDNLPHEGDITRELEPSSYLRGDGAVVMIFRDQGDTFLKLASVSTDNGETWSLPVETAMPDARTKQSAGNLPDGTVYFAGSPTGHKGRFPLALVTSSDGTDFDQAYLLRAQSDMQAQRGEGKAKRPGYHYTKSIVWNDSLCVSYATNKEDVDVTCVPLSAISRNGQ